MRQVVVGIDRVLRWYGDWRSTLLVLNEVLCALSEMHKCLVLT